MRALRWIGIGILSLAGVLLVATIGIYIASSIRMNEAYQIADESISIPSDAASIERGRRLATTIGQCNDCHGENLAGKQFLSAPGLGNFYSANLTSGQGGAGREFTDAANIRQKRLGESESSST